MREKMKKVTIWIVFTIIGIIFSGSIAFSDPININDTIYLYQREGGAYGGGAYAVHKIQDSDPAYDLFLTFCLETNEFFNPGSPLIVYDISNVAKINAGDVSKGYDITQGGDPLDPRTAYLYYHYRTGDLDDLTSSNPVGQRFTYDATGANALQQAIWFIEKEDYGQNNYLVALSTGKWIDIGDVRVMNLVDQSGNLKQDQLVLAPEPATLLLLGSGMIGFGILGRKRFRKKN